MPPSVPQFPQFRSSPQTGQVTLKFVACPRLFSDKRINCKSKIKAEKMLGAGCSEFLREGDFFFFNFFFQNFLKKQHDLNKKPNQKQWQETWSLKMWPHNSSLNHKAAQIGALIKFHHQGICSPQMTQIWSLRWFPRSHFFNLHLFPPSHPFCLQLSTAFSKAMLFKYTNK